MVQHNHIYHGNSKEVLKTFPDNYFHSIVTDPPYEIGFMGKKWDETGIAYDVEFWKECLRVLKPGGHLLAFSSTSTYHKMASAIEKAGFEIRDKIDVFYDGNKDWINFLYSLNQEQVSALIRLFNQQSDLGLFSWVYGQVMPKGQDISKAIEKWYQKNISSSKTKRRTNERNEGETETKSKTEEARQWEGWSTGLKPANEPVCIARKPLSEQTIVQNVLKHGTGAFHIDACRIQRRENDRFEYGVTGNQKATTGKYGIYGYYPPTSYTPHELGRFPANVMLDEVTAELIDRQSGIKKTTRHMSYKRSGKGFIDNIPSQPEKSWFVQEEGGVSRFFFCSKASKKEREWKEELLKLREDLSEEEKQFVLNELKKLQIKPYQDETASFIDYKQ